VPNAANLRPAYIKGFRREFSLFDPEGWTTTNLDLTGIPFCAVDVIADSAGGLVNGVIFEVSQEYTAALRRREQEYALIPTTVYDFKNDRELGGCYVFSANKRNGRYLSGEPAQERYLKVCLEGAKEYGNKFYEQFLATTYIGGKTLNEIPELDKPAV
jgi:cation transport regulator ChaC